MLLYTACAAMVLMARNIFRAKQSRHTHLEAYIIVAHKL
jgi:hypothetical protein